MRTCVGAIFWTPSLLSCFSMVVLPALSKPSSSILAYKPVNGTFPSLCAGRTPYGTWWRKRAQGVAAQRECVSPATKHLVHCNDTGTVIASKK